MRSFVEKITGVMTTSTLPLVLTIPETTPIYKNIKMEAKNIKAKSI